MLHNIHSFIDLNTYCALVTRDTALNKVLAPVELNITVKGLTNKKKLVSSLTKLKIREKQKVMDGVQWEQVKISLKR